MANVFANVFSPQETGYIEREELQKRLEELFPGSDRDFKIQHVNDRWIFKTPEKVTEVNTLTLSVQEKIEKKKR
ncbi:hypothetical protein G7Y79_00113g101680 [Physcia stellaris]|nr:hypothetical protein G7Y79_00113g101680 [Physcia stellaris]